MEPPRREGFKFVAELPDGADWRFFNGRVIMIQPNEPPKVLEDGKWVPVTFTA